MMNKNILIVDDHTLMRQGLKAMLAELYPNTKIFEAADGETMLAELKNKEIGTIIMDIQMPNTDSINIVEMIAIKHPSIYILVFSMLPEHIYGPRLIKAGARGYLPKESTLEEILKALKMVSRSHNYLSDNLLKIMHNADFAGEECNPFSRLSDREFEIVNFLLTGHNINNIAKSLNLKPSTVGTYKFRIYEKLGIKTVFELKDMAVIHNWNHQVKA